MNRLLTLLTGVALATTLSAQACHLGVKGSGMPGTRLAFDVQAAPGDYTVVLVSEFSGNLNLPTPIGPINLGVRQPWVVIETGFANPKGIATYASTLPQGIVPLTLHGQGIILRAPFAPLQLCTTNVETFTVG